MKKEYFVINIIVYSVAFVILLLAIFALVRFGVFMYKSLGAEDERQKVDIKKKAKRRIIIFFILLIIFIIILIAWPHIRESMITKPREVIDKMEDYRLKDRYKPKETVPRSITIPFHYLRQLNNPLFV